MSRIVAILRKRWKLILAGFCLGAILMVPYIRLISAIVDIDPSTVRPPSLAGKMLVSGGLGAIIFPIVWVAREEEKERRK